MKKITVNRRTVSNIVSLIKKHKVKSAIVFLFVLIAAYSLVNIWPRQITYSFSGDNCINRLTILPQTLNSDASDLNYKYNNNLQIFGRTIASRSVCFNMATMAQENSTLHLNLYPYDMALLGQRYNVNVPSYPAIDTSKINLQAVPLESTINFPLDKKDLQFEYRLTIDSKTVNCLPAETQIKCAIKSLGLKHNTDYLALVDRYFNQQVKPVTKLDIKTVEPVKFIDSSIINEQQVLSKINNITFTADREIKKIENYNLESLGVKYEIKPNIENNVVTFNIKDDLPRDQDYRLVIGQAYGFNNETLTSEYNLTFKLLNGPQIVGSSLQDRATEPYANISLYTTQTLLTDDYKLKITLLVNNSPADFSVYANGSTITINPKNNFSRCADIKVMLKGTLANSFGLDNETSWQQSSRAKCASSFSIGRSVNGRSITGYSFGSGNKEILYVGAMHGDENNSKRILEEWMWELEGNPGKIPGGTKVTVIPLINPDGNTSGSRYNANNVDLNRNFAANNWKQDIVIQNGSTLTGGGGSEPLSEPESRAIASYITNNRPELVLTYHSQGGIVESNEAANANNYAQTYSRLSGYGFKLASQNKGFFEYDVNGSLEEWAHDKLNQPVLLIELSTRIYHDFSRNKAAMWAML